MGVPRLAKHAAGLADAAAGSIAGVKLEDGGVVTDKIADDAITPAKILGFAKDSDGVTAAKLTANIGNPAALNEGAVYVVKDTADSNKIKLVVVKGGAFFVGAALTAAA